MAERNKTKAPGAFGFEGFQDWFKSDETKIDNWVFRLHHQVSFAILMVGLIFIFVANHFDGKAITCLEGDDYANKFCWLHGTGHVHENLQGKVTHCVAEVKDGEDEPTITYYLWLPFLLVGLIGLSKMSRTIWKNMEAGLVKSIVESQDRGKIEEEFLKKRGKKFNYNKYQLKFFFCEILNFIAVLLSMYFCNILFLGQFWSYGSEVIHFFDLSSSKNANEYKSNGSLKDPMCTLFPTEVSCDVSTGAIVNGVDKKNILCILSNNVFNQHYFFVLWIWWTTLSIISGICLIFRIARIVIPGFSMRVCQFKHGDFKTDNFEGLSGADFFVLDRIGENFKDGNLEYLLENFRNIPLTAKNSSSNWVEQNGRQDSREDELIELGDATSI